MAKPRTKLGQDPAFERFLGASVGEDSRGTDVTVLSMFARLGVDPWDEASGLCRMSRDAARNRLGGLMETFKDVKPDAAISDGLVSRLLTRLPAGHAATPETSIVAAARPPLSSHFTTLFWIVGAVLFIAWILDLAQVG